MPATSLFGCKLRHLSTDCTLFYFMVALVQVVFLFIYWIGIVAFARPQTCSPGVQSAPQQWVVVFLLLGLFLSQAGITCAAALLTLRGTPLEPSKRRWVTRLTYCYLASLPVNVGLLAYGAWVVLAGDGSCWSGGSKSMPSTIMFGAIGVLVGQVVGVLTTWNQLSDVEAGVAWHALTRTAPSSLVHLFGSYNQEHRGPPAALEEMATQLQRLMAGIEAEKTDAAAGLVCVKLLQEEAAAAKAVAAEAAGLQGMGDGKQLDAIPAALAAKDGRGEGKEEAVAALRSRQLLAWAEGVCRGAAAARPATAGSPAELADVERAFRWARFATAAYGTRQHMWRRGKRGSFAARLELARLAAAARSEGAQPLAGWGGLAAAVAAAGAAAGGPTGQRAKAASRAELQDFAAARELLGPDCQIICFSLGDKKRALLPHLLALDRETQTVVLGIAGDWQHPPPVPAVQPVPPEWLAGCTSAAAEAGQVGGATAGAKVTAAGARKLPVEAGVNGLNIACGKAERDSDWVHSDSLKAAQALLAELEGGQLLQEGGLLQQLGCSGWPMVLAGHGLGAGAAALLPVRLRSWQHGPLSVWAFGPPAELCSGQLAALLASSCCLTAVVVGDDLAPRATSAALQALVDQAVVGLARLRYCKTGLLVGLIAEALGPLRWHRRWINPGRALRPLAEVPPEALALLQRYCDWRQQQRDEGQGKRQAAILPWRVLFLSRQQQSKSTAEAEAAMAHAEGGSNTTSSSSSSSGLSAQTWQAGWVGGDDVAGWGVRVSRQATADHYVSRLLGVLGELAAASTAGAANV